YAERRNGGNHRFDCAPLLRVGAFIDENNQRHISKMECRRTQSRKPDAKSVEPHPPVVALADMPHPATFAKAPGRRCCKVAWTPPITTTSSKRKALQVIGNLLSHVLVPPMSMTSSRFAPTRTGFQRETRSKCAPQQTSAG